MRCKLKIQNYKALTISMRITFGKIATRKISNNNQSPSQPTPQIETIPHLEVSQILTLFTYSNFYQITSLKRHSIQLFKHQLSVDNFIEACYWFTTYRLESNEQLNQVLLEFGARQAREIFDKYSDAELEPYGFIMTRLARKLAMNTTQHNHEMHNWDVTNFFKILNKLNNNDINTE